MGTATAISPRPRLSNDFVVEMKRTRIMESAARVAYEVGIEGAKLSILVREASVARKTFYEIFDGKDDCMEQTLSWVGERAHHAMVEAQAARAIGHTARVRHALDALLGFVAEHPSLAGFYLLHGPTVNLSTFEAAQESFGKLLAPLDFEEPGRELIVGGIAQVLRHHFLKNPEADPRLLKAGLTDFIASFVADSAPQAVAA